MKCFWMMLLLTMTSATVSGYAPRTYDVRSEAMRTNIPVTVLLPKGYDAHPTQRYPLVVLLHGAGDTDLHAYHPLFREAGELVRENIRLAAAPGGNVAFDERNVR